MSCNCLKKNKTDFDKAVELSRKESSIDKTDYVIYEEDKKIFHDKKECWIKAGKPGKIIVLLCYR